MILLIFYLLILCFAFLSPFQNLLSEIEFVGEVHPRIMCTNRYANMKVYIYSCIYFFIVYIIFLPFSFLLLFSNSNFQT